MTFQQWCFSFRGRIGRRDFWIGIMLWIVLLVVLLSLAGLQWISVQSTAFLLVFSLWPSAALLVKRLHDRNKSGSWGGLLVLAWLLAAGNWNMLSPLWQWGIGRFIPLLITLMMLIDCGSFLGTAGNNRFGPPAKPFSFRHSPQKSVTKQ